MWAILLLTLFLLLLIKKFLQHVFFENGIHGFWKRYGIVEVDATKIITQTDILFGKKDITERDDYAYELMGDQLKFCGMLESPRPILLIKDLDLIKKIFIKDFDNFVDRRPFFGAARDDSVLRKMLGNLRGEEWKGVRASVTPTFTTGKIRHMMEYINSVGLEWVTVLGERAEKEGHCVVNAYSISSAYTVDVIASAIFGLQAGAVRDPKSIFSLMANRLINMSTFQTIKFTLSLRFPKVFQFFNIDIMDMEALRFFEQLLKQSLQARMNEVGYCKQTMRNDFLQLLVEAKKAELKGDTANPTNAGEAASSMNSSEGRKQFLSDKVLSGQCLSFFFAGFRTTSAFITFVIYSLALHPDIQDKVRKEVEGIFKEDGSLDYDALGQLIYLDMVISGEDKLFLEVLRKFPAALRLERVCVSEFHDPDSGIHVPKESIVAIPLYSIHNDKRFYKNPAQFDPEHFSPEAKAQRNPYAYMPFGIGPRNCIGMRFALIESKAALAYLIRNFVIEPTEKTPAELKGNRLNFQLSPPPNLEVKLTPIQN